MNEITGLGHPNGGDQSWSKWDELDQKFWEFYKTIDENKLRRNVRWFAMLSIVLAILDYACGVFALATMRFQPSTWFFALFVFGIATLLAYFTRNELAIWAPEKRTV